MHMAVGTGERGVEQRPQIGHRHHQEGAVHEVPQLRRQAGAGDETRDCPASAPLRQNGEVE
jgi:hypothetical protein